jgi:hypothetical protein
MRDATSRTASKSTSPTSLPSGNRLMPTSITTAPGLTMSALIMRALPTAATRMSAWRVIAPRSRVFEWQIVTVAPALSSSSDMGFPTIVERPTTTACDPSMGTPSCSSIFMTPHGVHG